MCLTVLTIDKTFAWRHLTYIAGWQYRVQIDIYRLILARCHSVCVLSHAAALQQELLQHTGHLSQLCRLTEWSLPVSWTTALVLSTMAWRRRVCSRNAMTRHLPVKSWRLHYVYRQCNTSVWYAAAYGTHLIKSSVVCTDSILA